MLDSGVCIVDSEKHAGHARGLDGEQRGMGATYPPSQSLPRATSAGIRVDQLCRLICCLNQLSQGSNLSGERQKWNAHRTLHESEIDLFGCRIHILSDRAQHIVMAAWTQEEKLSTEAGFGSRAFLYAARHAFLRFHTAHLSQAVALASDLLDDLGRSYDANSALDSQGKRDPRFQLLAEPFQEFQDNWLWRAVTKDSPIGRKWCAMDDIEETDIDLFAFTPCCDVPLVERISAKKGDREWKMLWLHRKALALIRLIEAASESGESRQSRQGSVRFASHVIAQVNSPARNGEILRFVCSEAAASFPAVQNKVAAVYLKRAVPAVSNHLVGSDNLDSIWIVAAHICTADEASDISESSAGLRTFGADVVVLETQPPQAQFDLQAPAYRDNEAGYATFPAWEGLAVASLKRLASRIVGDVSHLIAQGTTGRAAALSIRGEVS